MSPESDYLDKRTYSETTENVDPKVHYADLIKCKSWDYDSLPDEIFSDKDFIKKLVDTYNTFKPEGTDSIDLALLIERHLKIVGGVDDLVLDITQNFEIDQEKKSILYDRLHRVNRIESVPAEIIQDKDYVSNLLNEYSSKTTPDEYLLQGLIFKHVEFTSAPIDIEVLFKILDLDLEDRNKTHFLILAFTVNYLKHEDALNTDILIKVLEKLRNYDNPPQFVPTQSFLFNLGRIGDGKFLRDKEFISRGIEAHREFYELISYEMRRSGKVFTTGDYSSDKELLLRAIALHGAEQYRHCPEHLWKDPEIIKFVLSINGELFSVIPPEMQNNPDYMKTALSAPKVSLTRPPRAVRKTTR